MTSAIVYTIADRAFLPAVAGLINSLRATGFEGAVVVGSTERLPELDGVAGVRVAPLNSEFLWTGFLKARLLLDEPAQEFVFLDADIVVTTAAFVDTVDQMSSRGLVLALEGLVHPSDLRRHRWAERLGRPPAFPHAWAYYNGGFFAGRLPRDQGFLQEWDRDMRTALTGVRGYVRDADFPFGDQDALNALVQTHAGPIVSLQFPDWWSAVSPLNPFMHVGAMPEPAFLHCIGSKPWNLSSAPPRLPNAYESLWFTHVVQRPGPVRIECSLPPDVRRWLSGSSSSRLHSRVRRMMRRLFRP